MTNVFEDNPVLRRELLRRFKTRTGRLATKIAIVFLALVILYFYAVLAVHTYNGATADALDAMNFCAYGLLFAAAVLSPALSATAISRERETQTWEQLQLTRLTPDEVLLGKWIGRQVEIGLIIVLVAPLVVVAANRSDIPVFVCLPMLAFLGLNAAFFTMVGLVSSSVARRTPAATTGALLVSAFLCVGTTLIKGLADSWFPAGNAGFILALNPFESLARLLDLISRPVVHRYDPMESMIYLTGTVLIQSLAIMGSYAWMKRRYGKSP